jgi:hypothetical protein
MANSASSRARVPERLLDVAPSRHPRLNLLVLGASTFLTGPWPCPYAALAVGHDAASDGRSCDACDGAAAFVTMAFGEPVFVCKDCSRRLDCLRCGHVPDGRRRCRCDGAEPELPALEAL